MSFVATVIAKSKQQLGPDFITKLEYVFRGEDAIAVRMEELSPGRVVDYYLDVHDIKIQSLKSSLFDLSQESSIDIILQPSNEDRQHKGLFVFDMDSTLIQQEVIDLIASYANVEDEVSVSEQGKLLVLKGFI